MKEIIIIETDNSQEIETFIGKNNDNHKIVYQNTINSAENKEKMVSKIDDDITLDDKAEKEKNGYFLLEKINLMISQLRERKTNQKCKGKIRKNGERVFCHNVWFENKEKQLIEDRNAGIANGDKWIKIRPIKVSGFWRGVEV